MRSFAGFAAIGMLTVALSACGKYGPPERTVFPQERPSPWPIQPATEVPEERIQEPAEFEEAGTEEAEEETAP
jgi:hypothetical protein